MNTKNQNQKIEPKNRSTDSIFLENLAQLTESKKFCGFNFGFTFFKKKY